jgi:hypothetical protein
MRVFSDVQCLYPETLKAFVSKPDWIGKSSVSSQWICSQLEFYSISHEPEWSKDDLAATLEAAVRNKHVSLFNPAPILQLPASMQPVQLRSFSHTNCGLVR